MSLFKLAIYGGIGYLLYQVFCNEAASGLEGAAEGRAQASRSGEGSGGGLMNDGRPGASGVERTEEPSGMSVSHHVGRGVI